MAPSCTSSVRCSPTRGCDARVVWTPRLPEVPCTGLLHESDLGDVDVTDSGRAEIREATAHRDVARRLEQRQAEADVEDQLIELVGQIACLRRVQLVERLLGLLVDLRAAD